MLLAVVSRQSARPDSLSVMPLALERHDRKTVRHGESRAPVHQGLNI